MVVQRQRISIVECQIYAHTHIQFIMLWRTLILDKLFVSLAFHNCKSHLLGSNLLYSQLAPFMQDDLSELQDPGLASTMRKQQQRALEFWEKNWV